MNEEQNNVQEQEVEEVEQSEENHETDSTTEGEGTTEDESSEQRRTETKEQRETRLKRQLKRIKKQLGEDGDSDEKGEKSGTKGSQESDERYDRLELKTEGITTKKEQDVVLDYARWKGIDVTEALKAPSVKVELAELRKKASVPPPSGRTSNGSSASIDYYASQIKKGAIKLSQVESPEMRKQLRKMRIFS